nr:sulfurtransferase TusA family protein [Paraoerskovia sediminicola]
MEPVRTTVDARGLRCPLPVIRLAAAAREAGPGDLLSVIATDPAAGYDVPAWARMRGHAVVSSVAADPPEGQEMAPETPSAAELTITVRLGG